MNLSYKFIEAKQLTGQQWHTLAFCMLQAGVQQLLFGLFNCLA